MGGRDIAIRHGSSFGIGVYASECPLTAMGSDQWAGTLTEGGRGRAEASQTELIASARRSAVGQGSFSWSFLPRLHRNCLAPLIVCLQVRSRLPPPGSVPPLSVCRHLSVCRVDRQENSGRRQHAANLPALHPALQSDALRLRLAARARGPAADPCSTPARNINELELRRKTSRQKHASRSSRRALQAQARAALILARTMHFWCATR